MNLKSTITQLAHDFAAGVLAEIRRTSLESILAETGDSRPAKSASASPRGRRPAAAAPPPVAQRRGERLHRRSEEEIAEVGNKIVALLKKSPGGLRAEQIRESLGLAAKELPRPIKEALAAKRISAKGQKRATTYFAK